MFDLHKSFSKNNSLFINALRECFWIQSIIYIQLSYFYCYGLAYILKGFQKGPFVEKALKSREKKNSHFIILPGWTTWNWTMQFGQLSHHS